MQNRKAQSAVKQELPCIPLLTHFSRQAVAGLVSSTPSLLPHQPAPRDTAGLTRSGWMQRGMQTLLKAADLSLLHEDQKQKKQLEMLSRWCQVWGPQIHSSQLCQTPALSLVPLMKCILRFPDRSTSMGFGVITSAPTIFGSFENQLEVVTEMNKALHNAPVLQHNN